MKPTTAPSALRSTISYLICVGMFPTAAVLSHVALNMLHSTSKPFDAGSLSMPKLIAGIGLLYLITYVVGFLISALPCVLLHLFATRYRIRNPLFYAVAGGLLGLLAFELAVVLPAIQSASVQPDTVHWYRVRLIPMGCAAGLVYWGIAGRHFGRQSAPTKVVPQHERQRNQA